MKKLILTKEEKKFMRDYDSGKYITVPNFEEEKAMYQRAAKEQLQRSTISVRVPLYDLDQLKNIAKEEGMPYQTLLNSLIHKFVTSRSKKSFSV